MDRKLEPLIHRKIEEYLGEIDDDLVMFVIEHLKDRKGPAKLVEGLEPVRILLDCVRRIDSTFLSGPSRRGRSFRYRNMATNRV